MVNNEMMQKSAMLGAKIGVTLSFGFSLIFITYVSVATIVAGLSSTIGIKYVEYILPVGMIMGIITFLIFVLHFAVLGVFDGLLIWAALISVKREVSVLLAVTIGFVTGSVVLVIHLLIFRFFNGSLDSLNLLSRIYLNQLYALPQIYFVRDYGVFFVIFGFIVLLASGSLGWQIAFPQQHHSFFQGHAVTFGIFCLLSSLIIGWQQTRMIVRVETSVRASLPDFCSRPEDEMEVYPSFLNFLSPNRYWDVRCPTDKRSFGIVAMTIDAKTCSVRVPSLPAMEWRQIYGSLFEEGQKLSICP